MRFYLIFSAFVLSSSAQASLRELLEMALKRNLNIEQSRLAHEVSVQNTLIANSRFSFKLDFESAYIDSNFERDPFSLVDANEAWSHSLVLSKPFNWGGELALSNSHRHLSPKNVLPKSYLFEQKLSYSQDLGRNFLGRADQAEVEAVRLQSEVAKLELTISEREQMQALAQLYVEGVSQGSLRKLEEEALLRAKKRLNYVTKQVRDGLRERVDSIRSEQNMLARESALRELDEGLWRIREELGSLMAASTEGVEFKSESLEQDWTKAWKGWHLKENVDRQLLLKRLSVLEQRARQRKEQNFTDVKIVTTYGTNDWNTVRSKSFSNGAIGGDNDEWSVALQVSMPWGNDASEAELAKVHAEQKMLERYQRNWNEILIHTARTLGERHKILAENLKRAIAREKLARKALDAYNNLYSKGRINLEQVITAEEQLIADQKSVVSSRRSLVLLTLEAQALAGRLPQFLLRDVDI